MTHSTTYDKDDGAPVLKQDAKGRVRSTAQQREAVLREWERSGLSGPRFAAMAGINYQTLSTWIRKARQHPRVGGPSPSDLAKPPTSSGAAGPGIRWVEAMVAAAAPNQQGQALQVRLKGGALIEISSLEQVALAAALLQAVGGGLPPC